MNALIRSGILATCGWLSASFSTIEAATYLPTESPANWSISPAGTTYGGWVPNPEKPAQKILELRSDSDSINPIWKLQGLSFKAGVVYECVLKAKTQKGTYYRAYVESTEGKFEHIERGFSGDGKWQTSRMRFQFKGEVNKGILVINMIGPASLLISEVDIVEAADQTLQGYENSGGVDVAIPNGNFAGTAGWILPAGAKLVTDPEQGSNQLIELTCPDAGKTVKVLSNPIPVNTSRHYRISYRVRGITGKGDENIFFWFRVYPDDAEASPKELLEFQSSFDQWQKKSVEFLTSSKQAAITLAIELRGPGQILLDDLTIEEIRTEFAVAEIKLDFPVSYRDGVYSTAPQAQITGFVQSEFKDIAQVKLDYLDATGKVITQSTFDAKSADTRFAFPSPPSGESYDLKLTALGSDGKVVFEQSKAIHSFKPAPSEVTFNSQKTIMVNGQKFFPIGHTWDSGRGTLDFELAFFKEAGFNTIMMKGTAKTLDVFAKHGMMLIKQLPLSLPAEGTPEEQAYARHMFVEDIETASRHTSLLAYFGSDEPAWIGYSLKEMTEVYDLIRKTDPYHPVWVNEAPVVTSLHDLKAYSKIADIYSIDIYPVPEGSMHGSLSTNRTISSVGNYVDICHEIVDNKKPIWMILQSFAWGQCRDPFLPPEKSDYPTWTQSRFMAYNSIVHGATGIVYHYLAYARVLGESFWEDLRKVTLELSYLSPVLVEDSVLPATLVSDNPVVKLLQKRRDQTNYYIIINESLTVQKSTLKGFGDKEEVLNVLLEEKTFRPRDGSLSLTLEPYEVLVVSTDTFSPAKVIYHNETYRKYNVPVSTIGAR